MDFTFLFSTFEKKKMLPKKNRRQITVDGILYHYIISGCISVIIRNSITGEIIKHYEDWKPKWRNQMKPSDIEKIIKEHNNGKNI